MYQIVTILWENGYGADSYSNVKPVESIRFDFSMYGDEVPSIEDLALFKKDIDKVIIEEALVPLLSWYKENLERAADLERPNELDEALTIAEAKNILTVAGYDVRKLDEIS